MEKSLFCLLWKCRTSAKPTDFRCNGSCGVEVWRGGASSGVVLAICLWFKITRSVSKNSPRVASKRDINITKLIRCNVSSKESAKVQDSV
ncbi:hypothetical protein AVEN_72021-1 [Araneus ventricosus]|uniref:Uncharacterized protein n=1 Tax=Araneus ventricosus TaxID=182803 RepID=A0A4Y2DFX6_ARAVE|nr:hypothetical protein AVEN_72021-1 [Araneus ventricosus]